MKKPIVIMIANQKGGVGKTTCSIEISNAFSKKGYSVLAIDMDPQNSFSTLSGADTGTDNNLKKVLDVKIAPDEAIQHLKSFDMIPGSEELADASTTYGKTNDVWLLFDAIDYLKEKTDYDFIIIDSAPGRSKLLEMEYMASDYIIAPIEADPEAIKGLYKIKKDIEEFTRHKQTNVRFLGVIMNKYRKSNLTDAFFDNLNDIADDIGAKRFETKLRNTVKTGEARTRRTAIVDYVKKAKNKMTISDDFNSLIDEIIMRVEDFENERR